MQKYEGFKKGGSFTLADGREVNGELHLNAAETTLSLYSGEIFDTRTSLDIFGMFYDRSKVSLLDCVTKSTRHVTKRDVHYCFSGVFPHYVIFGGQYIRSSDRVIRKVSFTVDDAATMFYDFEAFGSVSDARPHVERIRSFFTLQENTRYVSLTR